MTDNELLLQKQKEEEERRKREQQQTEQNAPPQQQLIQPDLTLQQQTETVKNTQQIDENVPLVNKEEMEAPDAQMQAGGENLSENPPLSPVVQKNKKAKKLDAKAMREMRAAMRDFDRETDPRVRKVMLEQFLALCEQYTASRFSVLQGTKGETRKRTMSTVIGQAKRGIEQEDKKEKEENNSAQKEPVKAEKDKDKKDKDKGRKGNNNRNETKPPKNETEMKPPKNETETKPPENEMENKPFAFDEELFATRTIHINKMILSLKKPKDVGYDVEIKKPANLREALELRKKIKRYGAEDLYGENKRIYEELCLAILQMRQQEGHTISEEFFKRKDIKEFKDVASAAEYRNRILDDEKLEYQDLTEKEKAAYDYYDGIVKELVRLRDEAEKVKEHQKLPLPLPTKLVALDTLKSTYEPQAASSNDCWSCAAAGLLNQYMGKDKKNQYTAKGIRDADPVFLDRPPEGLDEETFETNKQEILLYTKLNRDEDRRHSPMGNIFEISDYFMKEFAKSPGYQNTAVRHKRFIVGAAYNRAAGMDGEDKTDTAAYHNLKVDFINTVADALQKQKAVALLMGGHYRTIVGIKQGETLMLHDSYPPNDPTAVVDVPLTDIFLDSGSQTPLELTWLEDVTDHEEMLSKFGDLHYDEQNKTYSSQSKMLGEDVAHTEGVVVRKRTEEYPPEILNLVEEAIYMPKRHTEHNQL